jgi:hypothetical protein
MHKLYQYSTEINPACSVLLYKQHLQDMPYSEEKRDEERKKSGKKRAGVSGEM